MLPPFERRGTIACDGGGFLKTKPTEQIFVFRSVDCRLIQVISDGTDNARSLRLVYPSESQTDIAERTMPVPYDGSTKIKSYLLLAIC